VAAKLTVDETKTLFAKWKPFPRSADRATEALAKASAGKVARTGESG
jgi:hypothetical protein